MRGSRGKLASSDASLGTARGRVLELCLVSLRRHGRLGPPRARSDPWRYSDCSNHRQNSCQDWPCRYENASPGSGESRFIRTTRETQLVLAGLEGLKSIEHVMEGVVTRGVKRGQPPS